MKRRWYVDLRNCWQPFFDEPSTYNWIDVTLLNLAFELSPYKRSREVSFGLLGFVLTVTRCDDAR